MKKQKKNRTLKIILFLALLIFLGAAGKLGMIFFSYYQEDSEYQELKEYADLTLPDTTAVNDAPETSPIDFASLYALNPDILAWVHFENMDISYPVVQGEDNDFYLHHNFYKEQNTCGCIFMDTDAPSDFSGYNTFIYGHNMKNKSMFARLNQFSEQDFYQENNTFLIYTPQAVRRYEIFACYPAQLDWDSFTYQFTDTQAYAAWQAAVKGYSLYDTGVMPDASQMTVTLMTCTPKGSNYRFLVHGVLIDQKEQTPLE